MNPRNGIKFKQKFDLTGGLKALHDMDGCPTLDVNTVGFEANFAGFHSSKTPCWIHSSKKLNVSSLFYSYRLHKVAPDFCRLVVLQLEELLAEPLYVERVGLIKTPVCGINWHIDDGAFRNCGVNIGLTHSAGYTLNFEDEQCRLLDNEGMLINVNERHSVANDSGHSHQRVLVTYSFEKPYLQILKTLKG